MIRIALFDLHMWRIREYRSTGVEMCRACACRQDKVFSRDTERPDYTCLFSRAIEFNMMSCTWTPSRVRQCRVGLVLMGVVSWAVSSSSLYRWRVLDHEFGEVCFDLQYTERLHNAMPRSLMHLTGRREPQAWDHPRRFPKSSRRCDPNERVTYR